jgi:hypothetical protein
MLRFGLSTWFLMALVAVLSGCDANSTNQSLVRATATSADSVPSSEPRQTVVDPLSTVRKPSPDDWFDDVTGRSGVTFAYRNGREAGRFYLIEEFGGGAAMVDFDLDGDVDLFLTGGGTISAPTPADQTPGQIGGLASGLFRNEGDLQFLDVTRSSGFAAPAGYSQGCAVTDCNADGFPDLFVCCYGRSRLYANRGDGTFDDIADWSPRTGDGFATAAAFGDIDRDGLPDLLLAYYTTWGPETEVACYGPQGGRELCGPLNYPATSCRFFHNSGDNHFDDWSEKVGMQGNVRGMGVVAADLNGDGWVDFFVACDETPNQLYVGGPQLPLQERGQLAGVAMGEWGQPQGSMGIAVGDYDGDGLPDVFVTTFENEDSPLHRNLGDGLFMHATTVAGLAGISRMHVKFGTALTDFDGDGWLDLFVLNGSPFYRFGETPFKQPPQLFRNLQGKRFEEISVRGGTFFCEAHAGRGNAVGDLDNDGAPDLVTVQINDPVRILRNRMTPENYVRIELRARRGEPEATGARVTAEFDGRKLVRFVVRGEGYYSQFDPRLIFPVAPDAEFADVVVDWPGRGCERFRHLAVRQTQSLVEGRGEAVHEQKSPP